MKTKPKYLIRTTGCNYHNINLSKVGFNKNSNLYKCLSYLYMEGHRGSVTIEVISIGQTQHSASLIEIYEGEHDGYVHWDSYWPKAIYNLEDFKKEVA